MNIHVIERVLQGRNTRTLLKFWKDVLSLKLNAKQKMCPWSFFISSQTLEFLYCSRVDLSHWFRMNKVFLLCLSALVSDFCTICTRLGIVLKLSTRHTIGSCLVRGYKEYCFLSFKSISYFLLSSPTFLHCKNICFCKLLLLLNCI